MSCPDENEIHQFLRGSLSPEAATGLKEHIDGCARCHGFFAQLALDSPSRSGEAPLPPHEPSSEGDAPAGRRASLLRGSTVGRYLLLDPVGLGAMGVVYAAYDPELNRKVAVKLVRSGAPAATGVSAHARLLREAQAMARISHPCVVTIYDVGTFGDQVFVAMELVQGRTLERWLSEARRTQREILEAFADAGHGLAAAHVVGLVHRDFKPDNVLVSDDGRILVTDFGLSKLRDHAAPTEENRTVGVAERNTTLASGVVGTPAFMAPEQYVAGAVDARADQFAFCVALYQALYGERPFSATNLVDHVVEIAQGRVRPPPKDSRVPPWLRRVLLRGLSPVPEQRYPAMVDLLAALAQDPRLVRRRWLLRASIAAAVLFAGGVALLHRSPLPCQGAEARLAGVWDAERRATVRRSLLGVGVPYAEKTVQYVEETLDGYTRAWVGMHREACEATRLRGEQSEMLLDLRMRCLEHRRTELGALTEVLQQADPSVAENAAKAAGNLTPLATCTAVEGLMARVKLPADPEARARIEAVRAEVAYAEALLKTGKHQQALDASKALIARAEEIHYAPLEAQVLTVLGMSLARSDTKAAEQPLWRALSRADAAGDDEARMRVLLFMMWEALRQFRDDDARRLGGLAEGLLERTAGPPELKGRFHRVMADLEFAQRNLSAAHHHVTEGLAAYRKVFGDNDFQVTELLAFRCGMGAEISDRTGALVDCEHALETQERALGSDHPLLISTLAYTSNVLVALGRYEKALSAAQRALAIGEKAFDYDHPTLGPLATMAGNAAYELHRYDEAIAYYQRDLAIREKSFGVGHKSTTFALHNLGLVYEKTGRLDDALVMVRRALDIHQHASDTSKLYLQPNMRLAGRILRRKGQHHEALEILRRGRDMFEGVPDVAPGDLADFQNELAEVLLAMRRPGEAVAESERGLAMIEGRSLNPAERAAYHFTLARALKTAGGPPERMLEAARTARDAYSEAGPAYATERAAVEAWLAHASEPVPGGR